MGRVRELVKVHGLVNQGDDERFKSMTRFCNPLHGLSQIAVASKTASSTGSHL